MANPRKLTDDDLWIFKDMGSIALSPDGRRVAFVMSTKDKEKNEVHSAICLLHLDAQGRAVGEPRQLTGGAKNDSGPVWAPDSRRLLFVSNREGDKSQLWLIDTDGGEARKLTNMLNGVNEAAWSPDGKWIAFTSAAASSDEDEVLTGQKTPDEAGRKKREDQERYGLRTITKIYYRLDGLGIFEKYSQLFVMPAPQRDETIDAAAIRRLTRGDYNHVHLSWTPDSSEVSLLSNHAGDGGFAWVNDLWLVNRETGEERCLTDGSLELGSYAWSPNGQQALLVGAQDMRKEGMSNVRLRLVSRNGGDIEVLTNDVDNHADPGTGVQFGMPGPYHPQWSADGERIYFIVAEHGCSHVYRLDVAQKSATRLTNGEQVAYFLALLPQASALLLIQCEALHPWEFYRLALDTGEESAPERLTHLYDRQLAEFLWSAPEHIVYQGANGDDIDGWIMRPAGAKEGVRYPLLVYIHGGPQGAFGIGMNPTLQYYAALGYAIFFCNPHGSHSCGEAFMRQVEGDWGGWDFQDIMLGVDECVARGVADSERMVVTGYSYGGYMSMFIIGHTDRFKAAVPMAGVSNLASFVGTSDIGFWMTLQCKGYPWDPERAEYYRERSPLSSASRVTTPTLFLHPENDLRCPIEQSEQFYMALKMMGKVPVEFVRVPAAWHTGTSKPSLVYARSETALAWFGKYVEIRPEDYE